MMQRYSLLRRTALLAVVLWSAVLLWTQLSPALHTTSSGGRLHGAQSYTVATQQDVSSTAEVVADNNVRLQQTYMHVPTPQTTQVSSVEAATEQSSAMQPVSQATSEQNVAHTVLQTAQNEQETVHTAATTQETVSATTQVIADKTTEPTQPETAASQAYTQTEAETSLVAPQTNVDPVVNVSDTQAIVTLPVVSVPTVEDNAAGNVRPLRFGATVTTHLTSRYDSSAYSLAVTERGAIRYTLGYEKSLLSAAGWKLCLYEEFDPTGNSNKTTYRLLNVLTSNMAADSVSTGFIGVLPGNYRLVLEVNGEFSDADVTVLADFEAQNNREAEPNSTPARYNEIYPGIPMLGSSCKFTKSTETDEDWYLFRMEKDGYASYTFTHAPTDMISVGWQIFMYDTDLNEVAFANASVSENTVTGENVGLQAGIYFICIKGRVHTTADYTLTVKTKAAQGYEYESNDTFANATPLLPGTTVTGMLNNRYTGIDRDRFKVTLPKPGSLILHFGHQVGADDYDSWNVSLCNENSEVIYKDISNRLDTGCISPQLGVPAGTYYVNVDSDNLYFTNEPYTVKVIYEADRNFEAEPNDTPQTANELTKGQKISGSLMQSGLAVDTDVFSYHVDTLTVVTLTFEHNANSLNRHAWSVEVTNADGNILSPIDSKGQPFVDANGAVLPYLPVYSDQAITQATYTLAPGDYYFRVRSGLYFTSDTYTLSVE